MFFCLEPCFEFNVFRCLSFLRAQGVPFIKMVYQKHTEHPASHVTLWVSRAKFASRMTFQGGILYFSGRPLFLFRGASFVIQGGLFL